jgi:hypothetical protein
MTDIKIFNWGLQKIRIRGNLLELRPTEIHLKEDGSIKSEPSFAIVLTHPEKPEEKVFGQISLKMLTEAMDELGYMIVPFKLS